MSITVKKKGFVAEAEITKQSKDGSGTTEKQKVKEGMVDDPSANVGVAISVTKNLGNYESVKVTVSLFMPCRVDEDEIEDTYAECKAWVDNKINEINDEIESQL